MISFYLDTTKIICQLASSEFNLCITYNFMLKKFLIRTYGIGIQIFRYGNVTFSYFRGINFVMSALVFNVVPTIFEVSLVSGILVSRYLL